MEVQWRFSVYRGEHPLAPLALGETPSNPQTWPTPGPLCHPTSARNRCGRLHACGVQVLQIFSPMGHALGLSVVSARLDDLALTVLFGSVYSDMRDWMSVQQRDWTALLAAMQRKVRAALAACPTLSALQAVACVSTRAKSPYSLMKKLATLSGMAPLPQPHACAVPCRTASKH